MRGLRPWFTASLAAALVAPAALLWSMSSSAADRIDRGVISRVPVAVTSVAPRYVSDRLLVKFRSGSSHGAVAAALSRAGVEQVGRVRGLGIRVEQVRSALLGRALRLLQGSRWVEFAERDGLAQAMDITPNDPWWSHEWAEPKARAPSAWDVTTGSPSVTVAVLDTGIDFSHPDLQGKLVAGYDFINGDADPSDDNGHGTNVAGIVGAVANNATGVASFCWGCSIMPVKVLDSTPWGSYSAIANGITWATDHGARVINMSLAGTSDSSTLSGAVKYAHDHGVVVVA